MKRTRVAALALTAAAVAAASLGLAGPAQATTTAHGCTMTPSRPVFAGTFTAAGIPNVNYVITISCALGLTVEVQTDLMEQDLVAVEGDAVDDFVGSASRTLDFTTSAAAQVITITRALPTTGPATEGPAEELYQSARFRSTSGPVTSNWTTRELTQVRAIFH